jgi:hypothetical protein
MAKRTANRRRGKAATAPVSASSRPVATSAATARMTPARTAITELDCPCTPREVGVFSVTGSGEGSTPAEAIDAARAWARLQLGGVYHLASKAHACKGACVGVVILRWPEPTSFEVIISAKHGPGGKITYRAFHGGKATAWLSCELLAAEIVTELRDEPLPNMAQREFVGWRLVPPGTTVA